MSALSSLHTVVLVTLRSLFVEMNLARLRVDCPRLPIALFFSLFFSEIERRFGLPERLRSDSEPELFFPATDKVY